MRSFASLLALPLLFAANTLIADENGPQAAPHQVVAVEVLIADLAAAELGEEKDEQAIVNRLRELDQQGKLSRVTRLRLSGLSEQIAMVQFGERIPLATGRSPNRGFRPAGNVAGEGATAVSYSYENVGTIVQMTPHIESGKVVLHCNVEQSRVASRKPAADKDEEAFQPSGIETITAKSVVQIKSGGTALLASRQLSQGENSAHTYILVTATIAAGDKKEVRKKGAGEIKVFHLVHAKAEKAANMLQELSKGKSDVRIAADARANALVVQGSAADLAVFEALLVKLDQK